MSQEDFHANEPTQTARAPFAAKFATATAWHSQGIDRTFTWPFGSRWKSPLVEPDHRSCSFEIRAHANRGLGDDKSWASNAHFVAQARTV